MEKLDKIMRQTLGKKALSKPLEAAQICFYAQEWGVDRFSVISFSRGVLKVSVGSSSAASELSFCQEALIDFVNKKAGREVVRDLRILTIQ